MGLERDFQRILRLHGALLRAVAAGDLRTAEETLTHFARRLRKRLRIEEDVLFPAIEQTLGDPGYPETARMRRAHDVFRGLLVEIERGLDRNALSEVAGDLRELEAALRLHEQQERRVVLPIAGPGTVETAAALLDDPVAN